MITLRPYQEAAIQAARDALNRGARRPIVCLPTGCHAAGHGILMADMTVKKVENISLGDKVMGPDSEPRTVTALHKGTQEMYRVSPVKGESFVVNGGHILSLTTTKAGDYPCEAPRRVDLSVLEYLDKSNFFKHIAKLERHAVLSPPKDLTIPPYHLGMLLGDGCLIGGLSITKPDDEIREACEELASIFGNKITKSIGTSGCPSWDFSLIKHEHRNPLITELRRLGLFGLNSGNKYIPDSYKTAGYNQRLDLIAGLLDTDGHLSHMYDWISKSEQLADDFVFICRSVGLAAYKQECEKYCQTGGGGTYYRVSVSGDIDKIPCRIPRKKAEPRKQIKSVLRTGFSVQSVGEGEYYGFECDGDHLYLDASFTRHHNSGKSPVICTLANRVVQSGRRIVITVHTQELIKQLADTYEAMFGVPTAVYAAGLKRKEIGDVTIAQIQSACRNVEAFGSVGLVLVDESDRIPHDGEGQYRTFLSGLEVSNPGVRVCGFTATPYRMGSGLVYGPDCFFDELVYDAGIKDLIEQGYLSPIRSKHGETPDLSNIHVRAGDYVASELEEAFAVPAHVTSVVKEIIHYGMDRKAWLIFVSGKKHGDMIQAELAKYGVEAPFVTGDTPDEERKRLVQDYKDRKIKCLLSINVLSVGFDAPHVDMIVMLRATKSPGLYYQQVGRGLRRCDGKTDCLILDAANNITEHGPIDTLNDRIGRKSRVEGAGEAPVKMCPQCKEIVLAGLRVCPSCQYEFPKIIAKHEAMASTAEILSCVKAHPVSRTAYTIRQKPGRTPVLQVTYYGQLGELAKEFVSLDSRAATTAYQIGLKWLRQIPLIEKDGFRLEHMPRLKGWIKDKETPVSTILELIPFTKCLMSPSTITIYNGGKYPSVLGRAWSNQ